MTDLELEIADSFERIFPVPTVVADWDDVRDRAEAARPVRYTRLPSRRVVAIAAMIVVAGLLVAPAVAIGDHLLELISGKSARGDVQTPAWSPDGRKLAFVSRRDGNAEIYVMNADGSGLRKLTRSPSYDRDPAWSPDGRAIAFVRKIVPKKCVPGACQDIAYLYVVNADGSGLRRLTTNKRHAFSPSWSADGKTIRYGGYLVNADGSGRRKMHEARIWTNRNIALDGVWSPDGQRIAAVSVAHSPPQAQNTPKLGLWVTNADGSNARRVAAKAAEGDPAWSPDGRRIAFRRLGIGRANSDLYVVNADGSGLRRLTRNAAKLRWFAWSPDGRTIAFLRNGEVYIVNADGSGERRLTQLDG